MKNKFIFIVIVVFAVIAGAAFFINSHLSQLSESIFNEYSVAKASKDDPVIIKKKITAEFDNSDTKGLKINYLNDQDHVSFADLQKCLDPEHLKTYPNYLAGFSKTAACANKRMSHDIFLRKLEAANSSVFLAMQKAEMAEDALNYLNSHSDLDIFPNLRVIFKGVDDTRNIEGANFSYKCVIAAGQKAGAALAGFLDQKWSSAPIFIESNPATEATKSSLLKALRDFHEEEPGLGKTFNKVRVKARLFSNSGLFLSVFDDSAIKRGVPVAYLKKFPTLQIAFQPNVKCDNPKETNLKLTLEGVGDFSDCFERADILKQVEDDLNGKLKELQKIKSKYERLADSYKKGMADLETGDPDCFGAH